MLENKELIFLVASLEQPRIVKRIIEHSSLHSNIQVYAFRRSIHNVKNYDKLNEYPNVKINIIGTISDKKYLNRIFLYFKLWTLLIRRYDFSTHTVYAFGLDLRIVSNLLPAKNVIYEISDIIWLYKKGFVKTVMKKIDFYLCKMSNKVIFTTEGFYNNYYNFIDKKKIEIKENKFKSYDKVFPLSSIKGDKIRIGYIGAFRYESIIRSLISVASTNSKLILNFYGDGSDAAVTCIKEAVGTYSNISYSGAFKNPDDLERIYSENNVNFVAYDNTLLNERVAMPNKFYESGFFNIPIICSNDTFVGQRVNDLNMGWTIDPTMEGITSFFDNLDINDVLECHERLKAMDKSIFVY